MVAKTLVLTGASQIKGIENFGDQLLMEIFSGVAKSLIPDLQIITDVGSVSPTASGEVVGALVGGGYFAEKFFSGRPIYDLARNIAWGFRNDALYGARTRALQAQGTTYGVFGVEFGPISNPVFRRSAITALNRSSAAYLRNDDSRAWLARYYRDADVPVHVDPVVAIDHWKGVLHRPFTKGRATAEQTTGRPLRVGLHIALLADDSWQEWLQVVLHKLIDTTRRKFSTDVEFVYINDQTKNGVTPERSIKACEYLRDAVNCAAGPEYTDTTDCIETISGFDLVVTNKLHVGVIARSLGIPALFTPQASQRGVALHKSGRFARQIGEPWAFLSPHSNESLDLSLEKAMPDSIGRPSPIRPEAVTSSLAGLKVYEAFLDRAFTGAAI